MHGLALDYLLTWPQKKAVARLCKSKPVTYIGSPKNDWDEIEMLSSLEKMRFQMYKMMIKYSKNEKQKLEVKRSMVPPQDLKF